MKKRHFKSNNVLFIIVAIVLALYTVFLFMPLLWGLLTAFKDQTDFELNPFGFPSKWRFDNFIKAYDLFNVPVRPTSGAVATRTVYIEEMFLNSLLYGVGCAFFATLAPCLVAYITAKYKFRFLKLINTFVIIVMILPIVGNLPSEMQMAKALGLYDHFIGIYFMKFSFLGLYYLVFYATFKNISWGYAEAALIDGASDFTVMTRVMFPLARGTFGVVMLLQFIAFWNDYTTPLMYLPTHPTIANGLFYYCFSSGQENSIVPMQVVGCIIVMIPILIIFLIFKGKLMGNISVGGMKG